jgi:hypothetical protein
MSAGALARAPRRRIRIAEEVLAAVAGALEESPA